MPLHDFLKWSFRDMLGIPREPNLSDEFDELNDSPDDKNRSNRAKYFRKIWDDTHEQDNIDQDVFGDNNFSIFNETLEIHRHMERQMNEMMKIFGMNLFDLPSSHFHNEESNYEYEYENKSAESEIRNQYLKPGFHKNKALDSDLDGLIAPEDLEKIIKKDNDIISQRTTETIPFQNNPSFFSRVIISRTITKPDGTTETHRTVKDSRTNEEETVVTITKKDFDSHSNEIKPIYPQDESNMWRRFFKF